MRPHRALPLMMATLLALLPATGGAGSARARQYLDRHTGATITAMDQPLVFARERPSLAVNARDYISLAAIDVNRAGNHQLLWYGYVWTTIDDGGHLASVAQTAQWLLLADTRPIALQRLAATPRDLGIDEAPLPRPVRNATMVLFAAEAETLEYLAGASQLSLRSADGTSYALWRDARDELAAFLRQLAH